PLSPDKQATPWDDLIKKTEPMSGTPSRGADEIAILMYTSGSTGRAKGVAHSFRTLSVPSLGWSFVEFSPHERMISYLPLAHAFERALVECPSIYYGFTVFFAESLE